jgi:ATP-dependent Lhr-like helicase
LPAEPACQVCHSRLLTVIKPWQHDFENLIKRKIQGKNIKQDEKKTLARLEHVAELVLTYGKKVIIALAGRGIGPETAIRILAKQHEGEEFLRDILVAEKEYIRTKRYWKI